MAVCLRFYLWIAAIAILSRMQGKSIILNMQKTWLYTVVYACMQLWPHSAQQISKMR
jgi:hypothetical protein